MKTTARNWRMEVLGYVGLSLEAPAASEELPEDVTGGLVEIIPVLPKGWNDPRPRNTFVSLDAPTGPVLRPGHGDYFIAPNQPELLPSPRLSRFTPLIQIKVTHKNRGTPPRYKEAEKGFFVPHDWTRDGALPPVIRATQAVTAALLRAPNAVLVLQAIPLLAFWALQITDNRNKVDAWGDDAKLRDVNVKHLKARTEARTYGDPLAAALIKATSILYPQDTAEPPSIGDWRSAIRQGFGRVPEATEALRTFDAAPAMLTPSDPVLQAAIPKDVRAVSGLAALWGKKENEWAWYAPARRAVWDEVPFVSDDRYALRQEKAAWLLEHTPLGRARSTSLPAPWQANEGDTWKGYKVDMKPVDQDVIGRPHDFAIELRLVGYSHADSKQVLVFQTQAGRPLYLDTDIAAVILGALRFWTPGFRDRFSWRMKPEDRPRNGGKLSKSILDPVLLSDEAGTPLAILMPIRLD